ncbi:hypothetical protein FHX09_005881 [Rhizobium sp. BK538]|nr:hypothetical protein [Rhizobium sp. BK538]
MTGIVNRLAKQDYDVEVLPDSRRDEIGEMNEAIQIFRDNGLERERLDAERRRDQKTKDHILQMIHRLQACQQHEEFAEVVSPKRQYNESGTAQFGCGNDSLTVQQGKGNRATMQPAQGSTACRWPLANFGGTSKMGQF